MSSSRASDGKGMTNDWTGLLVAILFHRIFFGRRSSTLLLPMVLLSTGLVALNTRCSGTSFTLSKNALFSRMCSGSTRASCMPEMVKPRSVSIRV